MTGPEAASIARPGWDYTEHPGGCHERVVGGVWTVCCRECAGTGVFPVPWIKSVKDGRGDRDASCIACKGTGRAEIGFAGRARW